MNRGKNKGGKVEDSTKWNVFKSYYFRLVIGLFISALFLSSSGPVCGYLGSAVWLFRSARQSLFRSSGHPDFREREGHNSRASRAPEEFSTGESDREHIQTSYKSHHQCGPLQQTWQQSRRQQRYWVPVRSEQAGYHCSSHTAGESSRAIQQQTHRTKLPDKYQKSCRLFCRTRLAKTPTTL